MSPIFQNHESGVHPLVWAAIGGGAIAVAALVIGLVIESGSNGKDTKSEIATAITVQTKAEDDASWLKEFPVVKSDSPADRSPVELTPQKIFKTCSPAVVRITSKDDDGREIGWASGFVMDATSGQSNAIVTNFHVIESAVDVEIEFADGSITKAQQVLAENQSHDIAILGLASHPGAIDGLRIVTTRPSVGDHVYAIGHPLNLKSSVQSPGDVSGYQELDGPNGITYLQTTAPISKGSSGGPLVNATGEVVGVTTLYLGGGQSLNFAVPADAIQETLQHPKPREVWRGTSIIREYDHAYEQLRTLLELKHYQPSDPSVTFANAIRPPENRPEHLRQALAAEGSIPTEFRFLADTEIGADYSTIAFLQSIKREQQPPMRNSYEYQQAIKYLTAAIRLKPDFAPAWNALRTAHFEAGKYDNALAEADHAIELVPRCSTLYVARGECEQKLGKVEDAVDDFTHAIDLQPQNRIAHLDLANVYRSNDDFAEAAMEFEEAIGIENGDSDFATWENLGEVYFDAGKYNKALIAFQTAADKFRSIEGSEYPYLQAEIVKCERAIAARQ